MRNFIALALLLVGVVLGGVCIGYCRTAEENSQPIDMGEDFNRGLEEGRRDWQREQGTLPE